jgi:hypothetical protein
LRKTFGLNRDEVTKEWIRLHNEELYDLYSSQNITRLCVEDKRGDYRVSERRRHLEEIGGSMRI